jgi:hypothetical protein
MARSMVGTLTLCPPAIPVLLKEPRFYFVAPKRLSNEFDDTIGAEPET